MDGRERLIEIMKSQGLNSKQLSLELGVSPGTISNILSGRNKPSLELLQNVAAKFPFIQSDWLFLGKGEMYQAGYEPVNTSTNNPELFSAIEEKPQTTVPKAATAQTTIAHTPSAHANIYSSRTIQKIMIFYSDGTFEER